MVTTKKKFLKLKPNIKLKKASNFLAKTITKKYNKMCSVK